MHLLTRHFLHVFLVLLTAANSAFAMEITAVLHGAEGQTVSLYAFADGAYLFADSTRIDQQARFSFNRPDLPAGFFQLRLMNGQVIDVVADTEPVIFRTNVHAILDSMQVLDSEEMKKYYELARMDRFYQRLVDTLQQLEQLYRLDGTSGDFTATLTAEMGRLGQARTLAKQGLFVDDHTSLVAKLFRASETPKRSDRTDFISQYPDEKSFLRDHFFDTIDFSDARLVRTPFLSGNYKRYFDWLEPREESVYLKAIDRLLSLAKAHPEVCSATLFILNSYFHLKDFPAVSEHLTGLCQKDSGCRAAERRLLERGVTIGSRAPAIALPDTSGTLVDLQRLAADHVLLMFWSPECESCHEALRQLSGLRQAFPPQSLQIYTVALIEDESLWRTSLMWLASDWINTIDRLGNHSTLAAAFNIRSIPAFYLIDRQGRIIAAPEQPAAVHSLLHQSSGHRAR